MSGLDPRFPHKLRAFVVAFVAVAIAFTASIALIHYRLRAVAVETESVRTNALPSLERLTASRTRLRHYEVAVGTAIRAAADGHPIGRDDLDRTGTAFRAALDEYERLPFYEGEREKYRGVLAGFRDMKAEIENVVRLVDAGDITGARLVNRGSVRAAADATDASIRDLIRFDTSRAFERLAHIDRLGARSEIISLILGAASVSLALGVALLAMRAVRRNTALLEERVIELDMFAGRVAHDVLSPLGAVLLTLTVAEAAAKDNERLLGALERGKRSIGRIDALVSAFLEFARAGARPPDGARSDVEKVVGEVAGDLRVDAEHRGVELVVERMDACVVAAQPGAVASVLSNLVQNAVKYMGERPRRRVTVRVESEASCVRIEVEDTGPGIPRELHQRIFDPYARGPGVRETGVGLGLATVKRLAEAHGGAVGVRSTPGEGSTFWVLLPRVRESAIGATGATEVVGGPRARPGGVGRTRGAEFAAHPMRHRVDYP